MAPPGKPTVLARIIAAHRPAPVVPPDRAPDAERTFGRALRHAATPFAGLNLTLAAIGFTGDADLAAAIDVVPDSALVAVIEDEAGRRGLMVVSHGMIDALIEVQTTGRVDRTSLPARPVTTIDAAMVRDFMDLTLAAFTRETASVARRDWPDRMRFGSLVHDLNRINLLLPDGGYHVFRADLGFGGTDRRAEVWLVLPSDPALATQGDAVEPLSTGADAAWQAGLAHSLADAPLRLEAVLLRMTRPLADVEALQPGDLIPFAAGDAQNVQLEDVAGRVVLAGRLGQIGGKRAVRLTRTLARPNMDQADERSVAGPPATAPQGPPPAAPPALQEDLAARPPAPVGGDPPGSAR